MADSSPSDRAVGRLEVGHRGKDPDQVGAGDGNHSWKGGADGQENRVEVTLQVCEGIPPASA